MIDGLIDTSVWIAGEIGRSVDERCLPDRAFVSVITLAELEAGVLAAPDTLTRSRRLGTLDALSAVEALPVDREASRHWARLRVQMHEANQRANVNNMWIAAVALAHHLPVVTQDNDFDALASVSELQVIHV